MALLSAIEKWRHYLQYKHFVVKTDHHSLKYLLEQKVTSSIQQKGFTKLLGLDYEVQYKNGVENRVADDLSRQQEETADTNTPVVESHLLVIDVAVPLWVQEVSASYEDDALAADLIIQLSVDVHGPNLWHYNSGVLRRKRKVYVGTHGYLRQQLIKTFHDSTFGGH